ncbi:hypothetical protein CP532_3685 [Ophiocordyceps camponoti-leonardi (nom. inval.)]|nr:hypothetical protein CP532_3685 [Ophiocordyceps camponoti-leonardi (nom. inval.)]
MAELLDQTTDAILQQALQRLRRNHRHPNACSSIPSTGKLSLAGRTDPPTDPSLNIRRPLSNPSQKDAVEDTAGPGWFFLRKTKVTPNLKRYWQLLSVRGLLDPKHRKKTLRSSLPKYCRVAEVTSGFRSSTGKKLLRQKENQILNDQMSDRKSKKLAKQS